MNVRIIAGVFTLMVSVGMPSIWAWLPLAVLGFYWLVTGAKQARGSNDTEYIQVDKDPPPTIAEYQEREAKRARKNHKNFSGGNG